VLRLISSVRSDLGLSVTPLLSGAFLLPAGFLGLRDGEVFPWPVLDSIAWRLVSRRVYASFASLHSLISLMLASSMQSSSNSSTRGLGAYWTIGHVMETGLVIPGKDKIFEFADIEQYLLFFQDTLVRNSGSEYEYKIAGHYCDYVQKSADPEQVPLLIPEFRYAGLNKKHVYRLDFLTINPYTLDKVGFELSPWSTHGYLKKIGGLT